MAKVYKKVTTVRWEAQAEKVFSRPEEEALPRTGAGMRAQEMTTSTTGPSRPLGKDHSQAELGAPSGESNHYGGLTEKVFYVVVLTEWTMKCHVIKQDAIGQPK